MSPNTAPETDRAGVGACRPHAGAPLDSYAVAVLGFDEKERVLFRNLLLLSQQRPLEFRAFSPQRDKVPHVVIVNGDSPAALQQWESYAGANAGARLSCIYLGRQAAPPGFKHVLARPFLATRLFSLLEKVVAEEHGYVAPPAVDGDEALMVLAPAPEAPAAVAVAAPARPTGAPAGGAGSVLVVDDSLPVRIQLKAILSRIVPSVVFAETGEEALVLAEQQRFDIVFLDLILPGIDGYETCRKLRKLPHLQKTPVIMLTSNSSPADRAKAKLAGCDTYLIKPVKQGTLENVIREFLRAPAAA